MAPPSPAHTSAVGAPRFQGLCADPHCPLQPEPHFSSWALDFFLVEVLCKTNFPGSCRPCLRALMPPEPNSNIPPPPSSSTIQENTSISRGVLSSNGTWRAWERQQVGFWGHPPSDSNVPPGSDACPREWRQWPKSPWPGWLPRVQPKNPQEKSLGVNALAWEGAELRNSGTRGARQSPVQPEDLVQATCPSETQSPHRRVRQMKSTASEMRARTAQNHALGSVCTDRQQTAAIILIT